MSEHTESSADPAPANVVHLRGRISAPPEVRTLPSGTVVVGFRLVVGRTPTAMTKGSRQKSDWFHCTAWTAAQRRRASQWRVGGVVEVEGAIRRRQFRSATGGRSLVEVEVLAGRRVQRAVAGEGRPTRSRAPDAAVE